MSNTTVNPGFEPLWDAMDVARHLKVSRSWVYQRAEAGELPCLRVGGLLRFEPARIYAYARGELEPTRVVAIRTRRDAT